MTDFFESLAEFFESHAAQRRLQFYKQIDKRNDKLAAPDQEEAARKAENLKIAQRMDEIEDALSDSGREEEAAEIKSYRGTPAELREFGGSNMKLVLSKLEKALSRTEDPRKVPDLADAAEELENLTPEERAEREEQEYQEHEARLKQFNKLEGGNEIESVADTGAVAGERYGATDKSQKRVSSAVKYLTRHGLDHDEVVALVHRLGVGKHSGLGFEHLPNTPTDEQVWSLTDKGKRRESFGKEYGNGDIQGLYLSARQKLSVLNNTQKKRLIQALTEHHVITRQDIIIESNGQMFIIEAGIELIVLAR